MADDTPSRGAGADRPPSAHGLSVERVGDGGPVLMFEGWPYGVCCMVDGADLATDHAADAATVRCIEDAALLAEAIELAAWQDDRGALRILYRLARERG